MSQDPHHTTIIINNQPSANANASSDQTGGGLFDLLIALLLSASPFVWFVIGISLLCFISAVWPLIFILPGIYYGVKWYKQKDAPTAAESAETPASVTASTHTDNEAHHDA